MCAPLPEVEDVVLAGIGIVPDRPVALGGQSRDVDGDGSAATGGVRDAVVLEDEELVNSRYSFQDARKQVYYLNQ